MPSSVLRNIFKILNQYIFTTSAELRIIHALLCLRCPSASKLELASSVESLILPAKSEGGKEEKAYSRAIELEKQKFELCEISGLLMTPSIKMKAFWDTAPSSLAEVDRCSTGAYCLHHQGIKDPVLHPSKILNFRNF
jgi:tRNA A37 threonylcarbamoyladenosine synthetase subunit TsaC/SUA5/YrdC